MDSWASPSLWVQSTLCSPYPLILTVAYSSPPAKVQMQTLVAPCTSVCHLQTGMTATRHSLLVSLLPPPGKGWSLYARVLLASEPSNSRVRFEVEF